MQVGSTSRSPPLEVQSATSSSPDADKHEVEVELLVSSDAQQSRGVLRKCYELIVKICSTHQFQNEQVGKFIRAKL